MKLTTTLFTALVGVANVHAHNAAAHHAHARRQGPAAPDVAAGTSTSSTIVAASSTSTSVVSVVNSAAAGGAAASGTLSTAAGAAGTVVGGAAATTTSGITAVPTHLTTTLGTTGTDIRPLSEISLGMPSQSALPVTATYTGGHPAKISGAPNLPTCKLTVHVLRTA